jgi:uncharacterized surface protein with fasciclin (FAS1) repeats
MNTARTLGVIVTAAALAFSLSVHAKKPAKEPDLVDVAIAVNSEGPYAGLFSTLLGVVSADGEILELLDSKGQYTVFAPINAAFDGLFATAAANCIDVTPELVNSVLKYHVVKGRRDAEDVLGSDQLRTLLGAFFAQGAGVITDNAGQMANIIVTDVPASNGIIHAIDTVLLPFPVENQCP